MRTRGLIRLARGMGSAAAAYVALAWAQVHVPPYVDEWLAKHPQHPSPDLVWDPPPPPHELELGKTQPLALLLVMGAVVALCVAYGGADALLARWRRTRPVGWLFRIAVVAFGLRTAWKQSPYLGGIALLALVPLGLVFGVYSQRGEIHARKPSPKGGVIVLAAEALCFGWSFWITWWSSGVGVAAVLPLIALAVAAGMRTGRLLTAVDGQRALERDAFIGAPLLALPLLGLRRDPSQWWPLFALAGCALLALETRRALARHPDRVAARNAYVFDALRAVVAPCALGAMLLVPMRFREIASINLWDHESIHLGWVNSITFGRFMMADAGFVYGPLREYLLTLLAWLGGKITLEHVREAHVLLNLAGLGFFLYAGWLVSRRQPWLHLWWAYVALTETQLAFFLKYHDFISFGWADAARPAIACAALVGAMDFVTSAPRGRADRTFVRANGALIAWGVLCGLGTLYSQDYGPCAFGGVGLAIGADSLFRRGGGPLTDRARRILRLASAWTLGVLLPIVLLLLVYACFGKAGLFVRRVTTWTGFLASASWSGLRFPVASTAYLKWTTLAGHDERGICWVDYIVPPAALLLGAAVIFTSFIRRTWTTRTSLLFAIFAFGVTTYRHELIRSDVYHLRSDGTGAILLLFALACDLSTVRFRIGLRARAIPIGAVAVAAFAFGWTYMEESWTPMQAKLKQLASGEETPSVGPAYDNADVPRAGDVNVPANIKALVHYVSSTTTRKDPVMCTSGFMTGGDLAFIIDRRNPTPFDVAHELTTHGDQAEAFRDIQATPPILIVGDYLLLLPKPAREFIDAHWKKVEVPGWGTVRRYEPPAEPVLSSH